MSERSGRLIGLDEKWVGDREMSGEETESDKTVTATET